GAVSLASSDDLEEDEAILTALADNLRDRAKTAQAKGSDQESEHCSRRYDQFVEQAVTPLHNRLRIINRLIELNMKMVSADPKKRKELFDENEELLRQDLLNAKLPPEEKEMGD